MLCCGRVCLGVVLRGVVGSSRAVNHVQITTVTTRDAKPLGVGRAISPLLCLPDILCCGIMTVGHVQQHHQRKALDQAKQVNPQPTTRLAKNKAQKAVNKEAAPKDPGPRASRRYTYRPSKALETGRAEKGLWSMIPEVNRYCCVVLWPCVFGHWCTWCCGPFLCGAPCADNNGDHKGCKALVDTLQTHIMACNNALPLCLAYVCCGREASKTIVLGMDNTLLVAGDDHDTVSLTFQPYLGEFLAMLLGPRASREDTYRPSKALETGRSGPALWSMIQEVNRYCSVVMWPGARAVVGRSCAVHEVQITTVTTRDGKPLGVGRVISPLLCVPDILCCGIMTVAHVQQHHQRKALDQGKQVNPQPTTRLAKKKAQKAVNKEASPKDPEPRASREDTYRPSKALETGRAEKGLWSMIPEVNWYCCVVLWPYVFGQWCAWCCGRFLCGAPCADNDGDHKGCKALVDPLQTHIMACSNALPLCLAYVCSGREA